MMTCVTLAVTLAVRPWLSHWLSDRGRQTVAVSSSINELVFAAIRPLKSNPRFPERSRFPVLEFEL